MLKMKKHMVTLACLVVGMMILTTSVYANFDDAKGYSNFKEAGKRLLFEETNFTMDMAAKLTLDDKTIMDSRQLMKMADGDSSTVSTYIEDGQEPWQVSSYSAGNKSIICYNNEDNMYFENERSRIEKTLIPVGADSSSDGVDKAVRFMELLADTLIGDLKNNVVLDSVDDDGTRNYSLNIEGSQIPELVNAGIALVFSANSDVYADGENSEDILQMYGNDARIESVKGTFSMDAQGRLTKTNMEATLAGEDADNRSHKATMSMAIAVSNYGTTVADVFDPKGKVAGENRTYTEEAEMTVTVE